MRNKKVREMAYYAFFIAIIAIMTFVPYLGYITTFGTKITIIHLIVLIAAFTMGKKGGIVAGLAMGILCMLRAWTMPDSMYDYPFRNPLCAVLPRFIFGLVSGIVAEYLTNRIKNKAKLATSIAVSSVLLTALHSIVTVPLIYVCATWIPELEEWCNSTALLAFFGATLVGNSILEMLVAGLISTPIIMVLRPVYLRKS